MRGAFVRPRLSRTGLPAAPGNQPGQLAGAISLLTRLRDRYEWESESRQRLDDGLAWCQHRLSDPRLYLGVVGEFSSGKSTLVNALLRHSFLQTDLLPETTCAATVIAYAEAFDAELVDRRGRRRRYSESVGSVDRLKRLVNRVTPLFDMAAELDIVRDFVNGYTATQESAANLTQVNVYAPFRADLQQLVIVDTPGTNVATAEHAQITAGVTDALCDMVLLVTPADAALPQSFMRFVLDNLSDVRDRCAVVVTRMDMVRPKERDRLLKFVRERVASVLGITDPAILPVSSQPALDAWRRGDAAAPVVGEFLEQEAMLLANLRARHAARISAGLYRMIGELGTGMVKGFREEAAKERDACRRLREPVETATRFSYQLIGALNDDLTRQATPEPSMASAWSTISQELAALQAAAEKLNQIKSRMKVREAGLLIWEKATRLITRLDAESRREELMKVESVISPWYGRVYREFYRSYGDNAPPGMFAGVTGVHPQNQHTEALVHESAATGRELQSMMSVPLAWDLVLMYLAAPLFAGLLSLFMYGVPCILWLFIGTVYAPISYYQQWKRDQRMIAAFVTALTRHLTNLERSMHVSATQLPSWHRGPAVNDCITSAERGLQQLIAATKDTRRQAESRRAAKADETSTRAAQLERDAADLEHLLGECLSTQNS